MIERRATSPNDCLHDVAAHPPLGRAASTSPPPVPLCPARLTATNISDIIYHQPACQSSHWVRKKKKKNYRLVEASCETTEDSDDSPPRRHLRPWPALLQCVILGLCCQKIIMPINFTRAGCSSFPISSCPLYPVPRWW